MTETNSSIEKTLNRLSEKQLNLKAKLTNLYQMLARTQARTAILKRKIRNEDEPDAVSYVEHVAKKWRKIHSNCEEANTVIEVMDSFIQDIYQTVKQNEAVMEFTDDENEKDSRTNPSADTST